MALFFASHAFAETQEMPQTESQKIEYMVNCLIPTLFFNKGSFPMVIAEELAKTFMVMTRIIVPMVMTRIIVPKILYPPSKNWITEVDLFFISLVNLGDAALSMYFQKILIRDANFRSFNAGAIGFFPGSILWALWHKFYYNQIYFLEKTVDEFEEHPEKFPLVAQPILHKLLAAFDDLDSKEKMNIYAELMDLAKPLLEIKAEFERSGQKIDIMHLERAYLLYLQRADATNIYDYSKCLQLKAIHQLDAVSML